MLGRLKCFCLFFWLPASNYEVLWVKACRFDWSRPKWTTSMTKTFYLYKSYSLLETSRDPSHILIRTLWSERHQESLNIHWSMLVFSTEPDGEHDNIVLSSMLCYIKSGSHKKKSSTFSWNLQESLWSTMMTAQCTHLGTGDFSLLDHDERWGNEGTLPHIIHRIVGHGLQQIDCFLHSKQIKAKLKNSSKFTPFVQKL